MLLATIQKAESELQIHIYDAIGKRPDGSGVSMEDVVKQLKANREAETVHVRINSGGGYAWEGFGIYNALRDDHRFVRVTIDSLAGSAASVIAMAGDHVAMFETSGIMIHNPYSTVRNGRKKDFESAIQQYETLQGNCVLAYREKTKLDDAKLAELMDSDTYLNAQDALKLGFCDEILTGQKRSPVQLDVSFLSADSESFQQAEKLQAVTTKDQKVMTEERKTEGFDLDEFKKFKATFGAEDAAEYVEAEMSYSDALAKHVVKQGEALAAANKALAEAETKSKELQASLAALDVDGEDSSVDGGDTDADDDDKPKCWADIVKFK
ncbi:head maturation protease, ClpP-related [Thalassoglobus polymorphus]|uniref:ATP-dependent Clp protease proteolytic subunit n=1 Tax=Thalassoglobus polymorphus TaxID=2527994 RepID=A0A517QH88_9PLAN|nr:head maturation protease, ClpP-related [Thalassoglobus polymorphus]QDT30930.1 ATP-dependent Clp protease proteolytic subunit [Thalassoglobus polymorphus]QDT30975.1 ATP-dependent Clp protease proteolytic subunit [Thalassoglobus polymorphus]